VGDDYELLRAIGYARSCGFLLVVFFVALAAVVAGARLQRSAGVWIFALSTILFGMVHLVSSGLGLLRLDFEVMDLVDVATSLATTALSVGMLIGVALIKPLSPRSDGKEARQ
jgi:hypothetical protein